MHGQSMNK